MTAVTVARPRGEPVAPRVVHLVWGGLIAVVAGAPTLYALAAGRPFNAGPSPVFGAPSGALTAAMQRNLSALVVAAGFAAVVLALPVARTSRRATATAVGATAFVAAQLASGFWHASPLGSGLLALPLVLWAMTLFPRPSTAWFEKAATFGLRVIVWGSLAAGLLVPGWAVQRGSIGAVLPGLSTRLAGLTPHPNSLGPIAVALLLFEWRRAPRSRPAIGIALVVLVWTQSKTSWAAFALVAGLALVRLLRRRARSGSRAPVVVLVAVFGFTAYVGLGLLGDTRQTDRRDVSTETFTGRTAIWEVTLEVWAEDPVLGYGTDLWDDAMDRRYASRVGFPPGHAHNQVVHTLGQAGLVGLAGLLLYVVPFGALARRADQATAGATGAMFLLLIVRCFSEPPLQSTPISTSFLLVVLTFGWSIVGAEDG